LKQNNKIKNIGTARIIPFTVIDNDEYLIKADKSKFDNIININNQSYTFMNG
jgi:hypothetical protein